MAGGGFLRLIQATAAACSEVLVQLELRDLPMHIDWRDQTRNGLTAIVSLPQRNRMGVSRMIEWTESEAAVSESRNDVLPPHLPLS